MTTQSFRNLVIGSALTIAIVGLPAGECVAGGSTCVTGTSVKVCVEWSQIGDPVEDIDFAVMFTDQLNPDIELIQGDLGWIVSSELVSTGAPANIGSLTTTDADNYVVTVAKGTGPGAADVGAMVLQPAGDHHSSLAAGSIIAGDLTGALTVVADSNSNGGVVDLSISGTAIGTITVPTLNGLHIGGDRRGRLCYARGH